MNITVTVDKVTLDTAVATVIGVDEDGDRYEAGVHTVGGLVAAQIVAQLVKDTRWPTMKETFMEIRREEIRAAVRPSIDQALSAPIQKTTGYGQPVGEPTTLAEIIAEEARQYMAKPSDSFRNEKGTLLQQAVRTEVARAFQQGIADAVKQARDAVTVEIGNQVGAQIAAAVRKGIKAG